MKQMMPLVLRIKRGMKPILIWDWDGTLVDSLNFKYDTIWDHVFVDEREIQTVVKDFIKTAEGKTFNRFGLIRYALICSGVSEIENLSDDDLKKNPLIQKYADRYRNELERWSSSTVLLPGVVETLKILHGWGVHQYIVSGGGTDTDLQIMARNQKINEYFLGFFGFGMPDMEFGRFGKRENLDRVIKIEGDMDVSRYIFIGDGESDKKFAEEARCVFIGVANKWNGWRPDGKTVIAAIPDLKKIIADGTNSS